MFKTKGFSSNNSLKRRAIIVDAPDLPPEEAEFYITSVGIADTEKGDVSDTKNLDLEVETLYEEEEVDEEAEEGASDSEDPVNGLSLVEVKGIGNGMANNLANNGVTSVKDLINSDPEDIASKISGVSSKMVVEWQKNANALLSA